MRFGVVLLLSSITLTLNIQRLQIKLLLNIATKDSRVCMDLLKSNGLYRLWTSKKELKREVPQNNATDRQLTLLSNGHKGYITMSRQNQATRFHTRPFEYQIPKENTISNVVSKQPWCTNHKPDAKDTRLLFESHWRGLWVEDRQAGRPRRGGETNMLSYRRPGARGIPSERPLGIFPCLS